MKRDAKAEEPRFRLVRPRPGPGGPNPAIQPLLGAA